MQTKAFKDITLSRLGMGNMRLPVIPGHPDTDIDMEKGQEIIDYAMAHGINYYDTAYVYHGGKSEEFLGKTLVEKYPRDSFYIATKFPSFIDTDHKTVFEQQLERLKTDYIDFYLLHAVGDGSYRQYIDSGCIEYFEEQKKLGRIKYFGFSAHASTEVLKEFADCRGWDFVQIQLNYFDWLYGSAKNEYEALAERNIPIMVMESVRGGRLASLTPEAEALLRKAYPDSSTASWAFRWLMRLPQVQVCLSGMSDIEQIKNNVDTFENAEPLTDGEEELLFKACAMFRGSLVVPCTGCRYCCDGCPAQINIPAVMEIFNRYKTNGDWALNALKDMDSKGKPADCIGCRSCEDHCPQNIKVSDIMRRLADR